MDTSTLSSLSGTGADGAQPHADIVAAVVAGSGVPGSSDGADALVAAPVTAAGSQNLLRLSAVSLPSGGGAAGVAFSPVKLLDTLAGNFRLPELPSMPMPLIDDHVEVAQGSGAAPGLLADDSAMNLTGALSEIVGDQSGVAEGGLAFYMGAAARSNREAAALRVELSVAQQACEFYEDEADTLQQYLSNEQNSFEDWANQMVSVVAAHEHRSHYMTSKVQCAEEGSLVAVSDSLVTELRSELSRARISYDTLAQDAQHVQAQDRATLQASDRSAHALRAELETSQKNLLQGARTVSDCKAELGSVAFGGRRGASVGAKAEESTDHRNFSAAPQPLGNGTTSGLMQEGAKFRPFGAPPNLVSSATRSMINPSSGAVGGLRLPGVPLYGNGQKAFTTESSDMHAQRLGDRKTLPSSSRRQARDDKGYVTPDSSDEDDRRLRRPFTKTLTLPQMPDCHKLREWAADLHTLVCTCSQRSGRRTLLWFSQVFKVENMEDLGDATSKWEQLDQELSLAVLRIADNALKRKLLHHQDVRLQDGRPMNGRQALWILLNSYSVSKGTRMQGEMQDLMALTFTGDLEVFVSRFDSMMGGIMSDIPEALLRTVLEPQLRKAVELRADFVYVDASDDDDVHHTENLLAMARRAIRRAIMQKAAEGLLSSYGVGDSSRCLPAKSIPSGAKTILCQAFSRNSSCEFGDDCKFLHVVSPCNFWLKTGTCSYGDACKFVHDPEASKVVLPDNS